MKCVLAHAREAVESFRFGGRHDHRTQGAQAHDGYGPQGRSFNRNAWITIRFAVLTLLPGGPKPAAGCGSIS